MLRTAPVLLALAHGLFVEGPRGKGSDASCAQGKAGLVNGTFVDDEEKLNLYVCCPASCDRCHPDKCDKTKTGGVAELACCPEKVAKGVRSCEKTQAPCKLSATYTKFRTGDVPKIESPGNSSEHCDVIVMKAQVERLLNTHFVKVKGTPTLGAASDDGLDTVQGVLSNTGAEGVMQKDGQFHTVSSFEKGDGQEFFVKVTNGDGTEVDKEIYEKLGFKGQASASMEGSAPDAAKGLFLQHVGCPNR